MIFFCAKSQSTEFHPKYAIKTSYSHTLIWHNPNRFNIEFDSKINRFSDIGVYLGYRALPIYDNLNPYLSQKAPMPSFGISGNIYLLPLFIKKENFRFDVYASFKVGGYHIFSNKYPFNKSGIEYGLFGGASFNLTHRIGLIFEYGKSKSYFSLAKSVTFGLNIKLGRKPSQQEKI